MEASSTEESARKEAMPYQGLTYSAPKALWHDIKQTFLNGLNPGQTDQGLFPHQSKPSHLWGEKKGVYS